MNRRNFLSTITVAATGYLTGLGSSIPPVSTMPLSAFEIPISGFTSRNILCNTMVRWEFLMNLVDQEVLPIHEANKILREHLS